MESIKRDLYLNQFINRKENGLIKIITGIRRCGKSYLRFNIYHDYLLGCGVKESNIITFALDDDSNRENRFNGHDALVSFYSSQRFSFIASFLSHNNFCLCAHRYNYEKEPDIACFLNYHFLMRAKENTINR